MEKKRVKIPPYVLFILITALLVILFPREGKFRYAYHENKPWNYGLLTAPFDFPIYKSAQELQAEQDSISKNLRPYYRLDKEVYSEQVKVFEESISGDNILTESIKNRLKRSLAEIYDQGIISENDYQDAQGKGYTSLMLISDEGIAKEVSMNDIYTTRRALSELESSLSLSLSSSVSLTANLIFDSEFTEKVKQERLQMISPSLGMVQAGEKIIDRGEIVTPHIFYILNSLKQISDNNKGTSQQQLTVLGGIILLVAGLIACLFLFFYYLRPNIYNSTKNLVCILFFLCFFVFLTEMTISYSLFNVYIIPYAIIPIVIRTFFDSRTAQMTHLITVAICALLVPASFEFMLIQVVVCMVSIYVLKDLTQRSELVKCAFYILGTYILSYLAYFFFQEGTIAEINWHMLLYFGINFIFVMFAYSLIFMIEKLFGYVSNVTLVELSDINSPALRMLSETSPGTFQHSLQVSMLGTAAAAKVGANPQLIRTGALYHDIGKTENPAYFSENRGGDKSMHDTLSPEQSARIITKHVPDGIKMAEKYNIPPALIKFISTHHGKGKAKYFYNTYKNQHPNEEINEEPFSYEGENPDTKETAILMMADSVEAASRSLPEYTEQTIRELVEKIIDGQIADGLLKEAPLTFKNITAIKDVFVEKLMSVYHSRIAYPELNK